MLNRIKGGLVAVTVIGLAACTPGTVQNSASKNIEATAGITDANIAAVVVAANNADISYANIAMTKSTAADVKQFAQTMINDHTGVNKAAVDLVTKLNVAPVDNEASINLRDNAAKTRELLESKNGTDFDRTYIDNEITYHKTVLGTIDDVLIPSAQNAELKQLLVTVRPAIAAHLEHAIMIQGKMGKMYEGEARS